MPHMEVGLFGGPGGGPWDDGVYDGVREIILKYGLYIDSIQVVYEKDSNPVHAINHGGNGGCSPNRIQLQYPEEYLVAVTGTYHSFISSLTFRTNWRTLGPFGTENGTRFAVEGAKILGVKGSSGSLVDAIGFHIAQS